MSQSYVILSDRTSNSSKLLLQVYVIELHNILVSDTNDVCLIDAWDEDDNIIISDSTLRSLLPSKLKQMSECYKVMCGC